MEDEIMQLIVEFYKLEDEFLIDANKFLSDYKYYNASIIYDMEYLKNAIKEKIYRGTEENE